MNMDVSIAYDSLDEDAQLERFVNVACDHIDFFGLCFDDIVRPWLSEKHGFDTLSVICQTQEQLVRQAIEVAMGVGRFSVLKAELTTRPGPKLQERIDALGSANLISLGHRVIDPGRGLTDVFNLPRLLQSIKAVCLVSYESKAQGTGFLVARDLVLTAAHVLEGCGVSPSGDADDDFLLKTEFLFLNDLDQSGGVWPVSAQPARAWRVAWSPSCINSATGAQIHDGMAEQLDFALVRMSKSLPEYVPVIDLRTITKIPERAAEGRYVLVGHPGGRNCVYDIAGLSRVERKAARVLHDLNSVAGMSGGPLLNAQHYPVALHEGSISCAQTRKALHNRAMLLEDVRAQIERQELRAYARTVAYPDAVFDPSFRASWIEYARRALQGSGDLEQVWAQLLTVGGVQQDGASVRGETSERDYEYPVFSQPGLESWLSDEPLQSGNDTLNIVALTGGAGTGKTFAAQLVLANRQPGEKVFVPETASAQIPLSDLVRHLAPHIEFNEDWRTHDGTLRNDYLAQILQYYESMALLTACGTLTVVVEFGECSYWSEVEPFWRSLLLEGSKSRHLRFVLVAPPRGLFEDLIGYDVLVEIHLQSPNVSDILAMAGKLGDRFSAIGGGKARTMANELLRASERPGRANERLVTLDAARVLIVLKHQILTLMEQA